MLDLYSPNLQTNRFSIFFFKFASLHDLPLNNSHLNFTESLDYVKSYLRDEIAIVIF